MDTNSTIQLSDLRQNNPAAISKYINTGMPICRAPSQLYWSSVMPSVSTARIWSGRRGSAKPIGGPGQPSIPSSPPVRRICCLSVHSSSSQTIESVLCTAKKPNAYITVSIKNTAIHASRAMRSQRPLNIVSAAPCPFGIAGLSSRGSKGNADCGTDTKRSAIRCSRCRRG